MCRNISESCSNPSHNKSCVSCAFSRSANVWSGIFSHSLIETQFVICRLAQLLDQLGTSDDDDPTKEFWYFESSTFVLDRVITSELQKTKY